MQARTNKCVLKLYHNRRTKKCVKRRGVDEQMYVTADEVAELLGVSRGYAYKVIRKLNEELKKKGYTVVSGKVSVKYFEEKFYGISVTA